MRERRRGRVLAVQALFQVDVAGGDPQEALTRSVGAEEEAKGVSFARQLIKGVGEERQAVDETISRLSQEWALERLATVDRQILRVGVYEIIYCADVPAAVAINEAVELAKVYSTLEGARFVNGILGALARERSAVEAPAPE